MKLTIALLLIACLQVSAHGFSQDRITLKMNEAEIKKVLFAIEKKTNYRFLFSENALKKKPRVTVDAVDAPVTDLLDKILANTGVSYKILASKLVVLKEGMTATEIESQDLRVSGKVVSSTGEPLAGVSVSVKGSRTGTTTDAGGNFSLTVPDDATLVFSSVGFESFEVAVAGKSTVNVTLQQSAKKIDEVVVIGYGQASKRDLTGSIAKISGKEISDKPNTNPVASLQSKVAGLTIVNSGTPGAEPDIRIRGTNSVNAIKPLYVVDGIFNDNIDYLNPNDIESIEILKDPSSLAIFGVRGANGVIAITTKKAKAGKIVVNFSSTIGSKKLVDKIDMVDAAGFKTLFDEEQTNIGLLPAQFFDYTRWTGNTDWVGAMTRTGIFNNNNISVAASTEKNKFYMGVGYIQDEGVVKHEKLEKILLAINDEFKISKALKLGFNLNGIRQKLPFSQANGLLFDARRVWPIIPTMDPASGAYYELAGQAGQIGNPLMNLEKKWNKENRIENRIVGSVYAEINFLRDFNLRTTFYGDMSYVDERRYNPILYRFNPTGSKTGGDTVYIDPNNRMTSVSQESNSWKKFQQDYILTYKKNFGNHGLTAIAGFTTYFNSFTGLSGSASQRNPGDSIPDNKRFWYVDNGFVDPSSKRSSSNQWERATVSTLFRLLYNYQGKYLLNASFRRDGSSLISPFNRYQNFYSVGAGWELTKENFMASQKIFDFLKVKASFGVLGNQNTGGFTYPFFPSLLTGNTAVFGSNIAPAYGLSYIVDRNLKWEVVEAKEVGFELYTLKNKLHVDAAYYNKRTKDIMSLQNTPSAPQPALSNVGDIRNKGFEISADWKQKLNNDLTLTLSGNFTTFDTKVISVENGKINASEERPNQTESGFPIGYFYGYVVEGVYQTYAEKLASPVVVGYQYGPGDLKYKDVNGDGKIDPSDRTMIGNPTPDFAYGGSVALNYKGFDIGVDFGGVYGNEVYRYWGSSELPFTKFNYPAFKMNRWHGEGTSNWDPILGDNHPINRLPSSYGIEDGSYFRLRNVQVGYNISPEFLKKYHISSFRIFANVQNLKTWKKNSGYTPEFGGNATSFGIDNGNGPIPRVFTAGINVNF
ncbi:MAG: TonB-dependent receptor [Sphingobacteriales bacterium]|nr:TonB-dependent receptor [Sphingobacteriales bacterium]